jgi:hypothetical protein
MGCELPMSPFAQVSYSRTSSSVGRPRPAGSKVEKVAKRSDMALFKNLFFAVRPLNGKVTSCLSSPMGSDIACREALCLDTVVRLRCWTNWYCWTGGCCTYG